MYLTNLTDEQWQLLCPVLEIARAPQKGGRPRSYPFREIVNGILYITKTDRQWRMLPLSFAPWSSVYGYFRTWKRSGVWDQALTLFPETYRVQSGKNARPTAAIIDAQSVTTTGPGRRAALTQVKRLKGENAISRSIRWEICWRCAFIRRAYKTGAAPDC